jgi:hypothetical protein
MTTNPFAVQHPKPVAEQQAMVDQLARDATLAVDSWVIAHRDELLGEVTAAARTSLTVRAAIGFLVGANLITLTADPPAWLPLDIPEHLLPDMEAAKAKYRTLRGAAS